MNLTRPSSFEHCATGFVTVVIALAWLTPTAMAQDKKKNPTSKVFISDVSGEGEIDIGDSIQDLTKKSVYNAQVLLRKSRSTQNRKKAPFGPSPYFLPRR